MRRRKLQLATGPVSYEVNGVLRGPNPIWSGVMENYKGMLAHPIPEEQLLNTSQ